MTLASPTIAITIIVSLQDHLQLHRVIYLADLAQRTLIAIRVIHILNSCSEIKNLLKKLTNNPEDMNRGQMLRFSKRQGVNVWGGQVS